MHDPNSGRLCVLGALDGSDASRAAAHAGARVRIVDDAGDDAIRDADVLLVDSRTPATLVAGAASVAREAGVTIILCASTALSANLAAQVDAVIADMPGACAAAGRPLGDGADAALEVARFGPRTVILRDDGEGLWMKHLGPPERVPDLERGSSRGIAAGVFAGVFSTRWAEHQATGIAMDRLAVLDAAWWGQAASVLAGRDQTPTRAAIVSLLRDRPGEEVGS